MGSEEASIGPFRVTDHCPYSNALNRAAGWSGSETTINWYGLSHLLITSGLLAYGGFLASGDWKQFMRLTDTTAPPSLALVIPAIPMAAALLPGLSYAVICLSWRRDAVWLFRSGVLCLIGFLAAAVGVLAHFID